MVPTFRLISLTSALTSAVERTSSLASVARFKPFSFFTSTSVAITVAPSATKLSTIARPIPCPAAVTSATLPFSRPANLASSIFSKLLYQIDEHPVTKVLGALVRVAVPPIPRNVSRERLPGVEPDARQAELARANFGEREHQGADAAPLGRGRRRDAPDQEVIRARLEDQHAVEDTVAPRQTDLVVRKYLRIVRHQRQRLDAEDRAVLVIGRALQRHDGGKVVDRRTPQRAHAAALLSADRLTFCLPCALKFSGAGQRSDAALRAGHSPSSIENHAVSRFCPLTTMCWRNSPS